MKPGFIGIGAQKCATTWIFRNLEDHPDAALSLRKELHFFTATYDRGYLWYESHFPDRPGAKAIGEFSTSYLCSMDAPHRAARYNPDFKIVVALRDPVDRAYSNHLHEVRVGHLDSAAHTFEAAEPFNPMYVEQGRYAMHLRRWLDHFPRERLFVLFQEEIDREPAAQASALYAFLGLDPAHQSPYQGERVNVSAARRSQTAARFMQAGANAMRKVFGNRFVRDLRTVGPMRRMREANQQQLGAVVPPMLAQTRARLVEAFADDIRDLARLIGRDRLPWPSWDEVCG
jgi:hypothetical protein